MEKKSLESLRKTLGLFTGKDGSVNRVDLVASKLSNLLNFVKSAGPVEKFGLGTDEKDIAYAPTYCVGTLASMQPINDFISGTDIDSVSQQMIDNLVDYVLVSLYKVGWSYQTKPDSRFKTSYALTYDSSQNLSRKTPELLDFSGNKVSKDCTVCHLAVNENPRKAIIDCVKSMIREYSIDNEYPTYIITNKYIADNLELDNDSTAYKQFVISERIPYAGYFNYGKFRIPVYVDKKLQQKQTQVFIGRHGVENSPEFMSLIYYCSQLDVIEFDHESRSLCGKTRQTIFGNKDTQTGNITDDLQKNYLLGYITFDEDVKTFEDDGSVDYMDPDMLDLKFGKTSKKIYEKPQVLKDVNGNEYVGAEPCALRDSCRNSYDPAKLRADYVRNNSVISGKINVENMTEDMFNKSLDKTEDSILKKCDKFNTKNKSQYKCLYEDEAKDIYKISPESIAKQDKDIKVEDEFSDITPNIIRSLSYSEPETVRYCVGKMVDSRIVFVKEQILVDGEEKKLETLEFDTIASARAYIDREKLLGCSVFEIRFTKTITKI